MKKITTKISIVLNLILLVAVLFLAGKDGYLGRGLIAINANLVNLPTETLTSKPWWQDEVKYQALVSQNSQYSACVFGDSISSGLGNTLGNDTFNFAIAGNSTISLLDQLKILMYAGVQCKKAVIAIGTNDANYRTTNESFTKNLKEIIAIVKQMRSQRNILIPAFYSTGSASRNPSLAGPFSRIEQVNVLLRQVALSENILVSGETIQPLFEGQFLKENLTTDGVHLNADGRKIYREALLKLLSSAL